MNRLAETLSRGSPALAAALERFFRAPRPCGWEVGSARWQYDEFENDAGVDATRYGDWEYSGRCTDF